ncbi:GNAT family N-acetyltransferase [Halochromatium roseum]|uniref:GNAT family N-acetyltransferase n=1 Tax=Halochromatium roseum TaxID=391920 RepID=UPI001913BAE3|nr:GNAT family N-acetyltransferase [Halochromatium roseum]MBK5937912.1 hypothetical protein [Halochromatium roseum]
MSEPAARWTLRWASTADTPALLALFQRAFGGEMSAEEWQWKYPEPSTHSLLAERAAQALAHYGGQSRRLLGLGEPLSALQVSDIMVDPRERAAALGRNGLFVRIASTFTEAVTHPQGPHAFVYGFPSPRATRLGELLGLYARMDQLYQANWPASPARPLGHALRLTALRTQADRLWQAQAAALGAGHLIGVRDAAWVSQRYGRHPSGAYLAWGVGPCWRQRCAAVAVYRAHADALELLDLLGAPEQYPALIEALRTRAGQLGKGQLFTWATQSVLAQLPASTDNRPLLAVNLAGPQHNQQAARFAQRCWMLAGDTDYR